MLTHYVAFNKTSTAGGNGKIKNHLCILEFKFKANAEYENGAQSLQF